MKNTFRGDEVLERWNEKQNKCPTELPRWRGRQTVVVQGVCFLFSAVFALDRKDMSIRRES